jgi:hypothetical protein
MNNYIQVSIQYVSDSKVLNPVEKHISRIVGLHHCSSSVVVQSGCFCF